MAITNFIPTIWSENLYTQLDQHYVGVANCSREFEGDIKNKGSVVKICGVGSVDINDYTKNTDMSDPQTISDTVREIRIDTAKYFNFQIDDIDRAQSNPKLMSAAMKVAANALANEADKYVYSFFNYATNIIDSDEVSVDNIVDLIIDARTKLYQNNVTDANDIVVEVTPEVAALILKAKVKLSTDNGEALERGCIGSISGCKIFVSKNVIIEAGKHKCFVRTKRAIAFAKQLSEIEAYRPEKRFSDAVKGLHLYGANIVYPAELILLDISLA